MIDWGAVFLTDQRFVAPGSGGVGYILFSAAMTGGRLIGDRVTAWAGDRAMLRWGGLAAVVGFVLVLAAPIPALALSGFAVIGLGCANVVPIFFRKAGAQEVMPPALAVGAITTTGYTGILPGPALIGFVAHAVGLPIALGMVAGLLCLVPITADIVAGSRGGRVSAQDA